MIVTHIMQWLMKVIGYIETVLGFEKPDEINISSNFYKIKNNIIQ